MHGQDDQSQNDAEIDGDVINKIDTLDFINSEHLPQIHFLEEFESARGSIVEAFNKLANNDLKEEAGTHYHSISEGL